MRILIAAGGTGGHLYPGIALARALSGHEIIFVVRRGDLGREILQKEGFPVKEIAGQGLPRTFSLRAFCFPFNFIRGWWEAWHLLRDLRPDFVVGMGGYLSFPVIVTAHRLGMRTLLHEQNVLPGLANLWLARWADSIAVSFQESLAHFSVGKTWVSGLPIRADIGTIDSRKARQDFGLDSAEPTFLVFGGSQGARHLNEMCLEAFKSLASEQLRFQVLHITGPQSFESIRSGYAPLPMRSVVLPYCHAMAAAYAAADWVVCRAGASTIAELIAARRPSTLVPYPYASNNHQVYNAKVLSAAGVAIVILEKDLTRNVLFKEFRDLAMNPDRVSVIQKRFDSLPKPVPAAASLLSAFLTKGAPQNANLL
jgi:UDP-N-acetylglucosamine--N-acetylmuramyl-(pentapeptide) pyrophosphoryl-undecaprenol N-acetylglucosamine transferase